MMDDSHSTKKGATTFVHGPEMEGSLSGGDHMLPAAGQVAQEEEIKRDLHSRHINMIAIAGMIVRLLSSSSPHTFSPKSPVTTRTRPQWPLSSSKV
jgi:amino acid permease